MNNNVLENLKNYLKKPSFKNSLSLNSTDSISFHWSNHRVSRSVASKYFKNLNFNSKKLWIKTQASIIEMTTCDLLDYVTINSSKVQQLDFLFELKDISLLGPTGPYNTMTLSECIDKSELKAKFLMSLLKNKSPQRSFRLNCTEEILMCYSENCLKETKVQVHQLTKSGILFKSDNMDIFEILEDKDSFKFYLNSEAASAHKPFYSEVEKDSFKVSKDKIKLSSSFLSDEDECYFFIKFKDINNERIKSNIKDYLDETEKLIVQAVA